MDDATAVRLAAGVIEAVVTTVPTVLDALRPDERAAIDALLARARTTLPAHGAARSAVDALFDAPATPPERVDRARLVDLEARARAALDAGATHVELAHSDLDALRRALGTP